MKMQSKKFQLVKLGIEEIPEYIHALQEQSGQDVETISFQQTDLMDVVRPVEIVFRRRGDKSHADAMSELAQKVSVLADAINSVSTLPQTTLRRQE